MSKKMSKYFLLVSTRRSGEIKIIVYKLGGVMANAELNILSNCLREVIDKEMKKEEKDKMLFLALRIVKLADNGRDYQGLYAIFLALAYNATQDESAKYLIRGVYNELKAGPNNAKPLRASAEVVAKLVREGYLKEDKRGVFVNRRV